MNEIGWKMDLIPCVVLIFNPHCNQILSRYTAYRLKQQPLMANANHVSYSLQESESFIENCEHEIDR